MAKTVRRVDVQIDVFKCTVVVWVGDPVRMVRELSKEGYPFPKGYPNDDDCSLAGSTLGARGWRDKVVWLRRMDVPVLAHEAVHAASMICADKGVKDEEALCYLVEHIVRSVLGTETKQVKKEKRR